MLGSANGTRVIALTGNIGSGKTAVADMLARKGARIIDADELSREAVRPGSPALKAIVARWGDHLLKADGSLDRDALRRTVFHDRAELDALNAIVHPEISRLRQREIDAARARGDRLVVAVIPLLFERKLADQFNYIVLVDAPRPLRLDRIVRDRGIGEAEAMDMIASQMPAELKRARADRVIENTGSINQLQSEVDRLWNELEGDNANALSASGA